MAETKWITNIRDAIPVPMKDITGAPFTGYTGSSICTTCKKEMPVCWDTVCAGCGDTSCYEHSETVDRKWYCPKCVDKAERRWALYNQEARDARHESP